MPLYDEWLDDHIGRSLDRQRASSDTAKLLVTFVGAIGATLVASALEVDGDAWQSVASAVALAVGVVLTVAVFRVDRLAEADREEVAQRALMNPWSESDILRELRNAALTAVEGNDELLASQQRLVAAQAIATLAASVLACMSLVSR